jgi:hypothetical protein
MLVPSAAMRILLNISIPHDKFNAAVKDGTAGEKLDRILAELKPEAAYFTEYGGKRGAMIVVNVEDPSKIPSIAEPWFLLFNADVHFHVAMTPEELQRGHVDDLGKKWA